MNSEPRKRITMKLKHPNPHFEQWLTEWRDDAIQKGSKMQHCYGKALQSLQKYPLPLASGRDCRILQGFGEKLCQMLDKKLGELKPGNPSSLASLDSTFHNSKDKQIKKRCLTGQVLNTSAEQREYVPEWRSGPYAILITLYEKSLEPGYLGYLLKSDIVKHGRHLCDKSFVKPDAGSYYTAWSSIKTLLDKNLVVKEKSPAQFSLTNVGLVLAHKLYRNNLKENNPDTKQLRSENKRQLKSKSISDVGSTDSQQSSSSLAKTESQLKDEIKPVVTCSLSDNQEETFIFISHSFQIVLLVDKQETAGGTCSLLDDALLSELTNLAVCYETRHLKIGDYAWLCRQNSSSDKELILPYIMERKRMDDFACSIKDGRFHEQKFRLKQCGVQNLVYLIESYGNNTHTGLPIATLHQAATNTLVQDGFSVKFTESLRGTAHYLASFTTILMNIYKYAFYAQEKTLVSCPKQNLSQSTVYDDLIPLMTFQEFNKGASKSRNFKVQELFVRQLLQLSGISVEKALAIMNKYSTPLQLRTAYKTNPNNGEKLLAPLQYGKLGKKIGPAISKTIYQLYSSTSF